MTKEDIKQICQIYDNLRRERDAATIVYNSDDTFWEHILATYNLSQPSLPSNIDEAAEEYAVNHQAHDIFDCYGNPESDVIGKRLAFMAGVKWMTEQGETIFDTVVIDGQGQRWLTDNLLLGDYDSGEEVIVQIRKK